MDTDSSEKVTVLDRVNDLRQQVVTADELLFLSRGYPSAGIISYPESPGVGIPSTSFGKMASFVHVRSRRKNDVKNTTLLNANSEHYALWVDAIAKKVEFWSRDVNLVSIGDKGINDIWLLGAITLVRYRVLSHMDWFPKAQIRNVSSMTKHSALFGADIFHGMRELKERYANDKRHAHLIDSELTQWLVFLAVAKNYSESDMYELLATG